MAVRISDWCCLLGFISSKHLGIIIYLGKGVVGTWQNINPLFNCMQLSQQRLEYEMSPFIEKALSKVIKQAFCTSHHTDDGGRINIHREGALMVFFPRLISSHWFVFNEVTQAASAAEQNRQRSSSSAVLHSCLKQRRLNRTIYGCFVFRFAEQYYSVLLVRT